MNRAENAAQHALDMDVQIKLVLEKKHTGKKLQATLVDIGAHYWLKFGSKTDIFRNVNELGVWYDVPLERGGYTTGLIPWRDVFAKLLEL